MTEYTKLDPEFKAKWIKALRIGKYEQAQETLCEISEPKNKYCCLGVACDILNPTGWFDDEDTGEYRNWHPPGSVGFLEWSTTHVPGIDTTQATTKLVRMNDGGAPFSEIADWIEENL